MEEERHVSSYVHIYDEQEISKYTVTFDTERQDHIVSKNNNNSI